MKKFWAGVAVCLLIFTAGCARTPEAAPQSGVSGEPAAMLAGTNILDDAAPTPDADEDLEVLELNPEEKERISQVQITEAAPELTLEEIRSVQFEDVSPEDERADFISYAAYRSYLPGKDETHFAPDEPVTRAELVSALYRMGGGEESNLAVAFADMPSDADYGTALSWAVKAGIVTGTVDGLFQPDKQVNREQLAVFLYRFAVYDDGRTYDASLPGYQDGSDIIDSAREPLAWALENKIFAGIVWDTIHPKFPVSRSQLAQALTAVDSYANMEPVAETLTDRLSANAARSVSREMHEDIQSAVERVSEKYGAVGMQVAVIEGGQLTDAYACGWAVRGSEKMTPDHKIRIASLTKAGVGIAAMALYEDGVIDLDESIGTYWGIETKNPYYPDAPVSIRTLLTHTSSIPILGDDASRTKDAVRYRLETNNYVRLRPGAVSSWGYNNYAYGVLGQTLELAAGKYLDDVMQERLWGIMEIDAAFESGNIRDKSLLATVYQYSSVGRSAESMAYNIRKGEPGATGIYFSGGMTISARDLGKMTALLANDGCYEGLRLLKKETVDTMEERCEPQLEDGSYQALALRSQDRMYGRERLYYHTGSAYGVYNWISYDPDTKDGVVVLTTGARGIKDERNIYAVCGEISSYIYEALSTPTSAPGEPKANHVGTTDDILK